MPWPDMLFVFVFESADGRAQAPHTDGPHAACPCTACLAGGEEGGH